MAPPPTSGATVQLGWAAKPDRGYAELIKEFAMKKVA